MFKAGTTNEPDHGRWIEAALKKIRAGLKLLDAGAGESHFRNWFAMAYMFLQEKNNHPHV
jgi:hypothetical protein